jgi:3-oxoacyl-[acyl-carrier-protein] synthase-1
MAHVSAVTTGTEPNPFMSGGRSLGEGIADVVQRTLDEAGISVPYRFDVVADLNGESWRSEEYGHARVRIPSSAWEGDRLALPAESTGDIGAAMTALEVAMASYSLKRRYSAGRNVMLISSDEYGEVGAAILERAD